MHETQFFDVDSHLQIINEKIITDCNSDSILAKQVCHHLLALHGKRLRAKITLLTAAACNLEIKQNEDLAIIVEWLHAATLLHDDVIDDAKTRRHQQTANQVWSNSASILAGDYLYALAFKKIAQLQNHQITQTIANATASIIEGEILQLENRFSLYADLDCYIQTISGKTAILFATAAELPAIAANLDNKVIKALHQFGYYFGIAYQMLDDVKDYNTSSDVLGKTQFQDLADGTSTLPLMILAKNYSKDTIISALQGSKEDQTTIIKFFENDASIIKSCYTKINHYTELAINELQHLPNSYYKQQLKDLAMQITAK